MGSDLSMDVELACGFDAAIERVTEELAKEGFGILTRADVHGAFKKKLGVVFRPYVILGACNPALAHKALSARPEAGLLLPCNVIVEEISPGVCTARIVAPAAMMAAAGFETDPVLSQVGGEADARLSRVAEALRGYRGE